MYNALVIVSLGANNCNKLDFLKVEHLLAQRNKVPATGKKTVGEDGLSYST